MASSAPSYPPGSPTPAVSAAPATAEPRAPDGTPQGAPGGQRLIRVADIVGTHGIKGWVRLRSYTAEPRDMVRYGPLTDATGQRRYKVKLRGQVRSLLLGEVEGIADRNAAERLVGIQLHVTRARLPRPDEDEFYHVDLIGVAATLSDGTPLGRVKAVHDFGAGPLLELTGITAKPLLVPFTRQIVPQVDLHGGQLTIDPPPGLLEGEIIPPAPREPLSPFGPGFALGVPARRVGLRRLAGMVRDEGGRA